MQHPTFPHRRNTSLTEWVANPRKGSVTAFVIRLLLAVSAITVGSPCLGIDKGQTPSIEWLDARELTVEGQGWSDTESSFDRLPSRAKSKVREKVWNLSHHSAGIVVRFKTDASEIYARWELTLPQLTRARMPATSASGLDLYVKHNDGWRWLACAGPQKQETSATLVAGIKPAMREYKLYLPLYNGVSHLEIGVPAGATLEAAPDRLAEVKPIVFYGTSITQGGCASRPGMTHVAMLGRRFDRPVINLGFSGNGRMEPDVVRFMAEIDAAVFVIDCLPNIGHRYVTERAVPCVRILREFHPTTPIVLVEDRSYQDGFLLTAKAERNRLSRAALRAAYDELHEAGDKNLHYLKGDELLGPDNEATIDGSHPTDLGFVRQADAFEKAFSPFMTPLSASVTGQ